MNNAKTSFIKAFYKLMEPFFQACSDGKECRINVYNCDECLTGTVFMTKRINIDEYIVNCDWNHGMISAYTTQEFGGKLGQWMMEGYDIEYLANGIRGKININELLKEMGLR